MIGRWWRRRRALRGCFHHNPHTGQSFVVGRIFDAGRGKLWRCSTCGKSWT